jgi:ring-1,2-phenylacetyl-CoA epoxidase subunit PaaC
MKNQLYQYVLRLGDNALIMGHRLGEWCSKAPILEEDLALTNFALDYIGRTELLLNYAAEIDGTGKSEDDLAYKRKERDFYNLLITELPNGNFADTMAKQFLFSSYEFLFYTQLLNSKDEKLAAIAQKAIKEIKYHLKHASDWVIKLGDGTHESHYKMQKAINDCWMYTGELFEMDTLDEAMCDLQIGVNSSLLNSEWHLMVIEVLSAANINIPNDSYMQTGSKKGIHTEHLGYILTDMQYLPRAYPEAKW